MFNASNKYILLLLFAFSLNLAHGENQKIQLATFAGGCFWCMEGPFEKSQGVLKVISGYAGGEKSNPTYQQVSAGQTKHREAVQVHFDPKKISYMQLLDIFWRNINPTDAGGQFADRGHHYTTAIFYHTPTQKRVAERSKKNLGDSKKFKAKIVTPIIQYSNFYPAEKYHQDYYKKNPTRYNRYRVGSGRAKYLEKIWGTKH